MATRFHIKPGYQEQAIPAGVPYFLDDPKPASHDPSVTITFQPDVYTLAELLADCLAAPDRATIVDVGCGWGEKLSAIHDRHPDWLLGGVDFGANIAHCRETYGWGWWTEIDLETITQTPPADVVICSDVIEHLADPTALLSALAGSLALIVLSTPERDVQHGYDHMGPSPNACHVREWNAGELHSYLEASGLRVRHLGLTRGSDLGWAMATQVAICEPAR